MKIVHSLGKKSAEREANSAGFFLTNRAGSFLHLFNSPASKYHGFFFNDRELYRVIEEIRLAGHAEASSLTNRFFCVERQREDVTERFFVPHGLNSVVYELSRPRVVEIVLDVKRAYDDRQWGRKYGVQKEKGILVVEFVKSTDKKEDQSDGVEEYRLYLAVKSNIVGYKETGEWVYRSYESDKKRRSSSERYVYSAATFMTKKAVFSVSRSREGAIREAEHVFRNTEELKHRQRAYYEKLCAGEMNIACARAALDSMAVEGGMCAGLPWFFQLWSRDEIVSMKAIASIQKEAAKKRLLSYWKLLHSDGRLPNIVGAEEGNADAAGWLFCRSEDLLMLFSNAEKKQLQKALEKAISLIESNHIKDSFVFNARNETWMDTTYNDDGRQGARIEVQALQLRMYRLMQKLSRQKTYLQKENKLKALVRQRFWNGRWLADGLNDFTIRPNVFLAAYIYPWLLSEKEWETCFRNVLPSLWLSWGGLASIDKGNQLFTDEYTGETNASYHRGDSWFWVNNLAAIILHRTDKRDLMKYASEIFKASTQELMWMGAAGCHAEVSSAKELRSEGCLNQLWSNALYLELAEEMRNR